MKKFLTLLLATVMPLIIFSQAPNFTMTSTDGETYNLHEQLDSGKVVVLDFFSTTCGTCQTGVPTVEKIWTEVLSEGDRGWVWAIEIGYHDEIQIDEFFNEYGGTFPAFSVVEDDSIINPDFGFDVPYAPQYFVVCPDYKYQNLPLNMVESQIEKCGQQTGVAQNLTQMKVKTRSNSFMLDNLPPTSGKFRIQIINTLGSVISNDLISGASKNWESPQLDKGIYIIQLTVGQRLHFSRKIALN